MLAVFMCINLFLFMYINVPKSANGQSEREINRYNKYIESYHDEIDSVIKNADYLQKYIQHDFTNSQGFQAYPEC